MPSSSMSNASMTQISASRSISSSRSDGGIRGSRPQMARDLGRTRTIDIDQIWTPRFLLVNNRGLSMALPDVVEIDDHRTRRLPATIQRRNVGEPRVQ